tara:strand:+ start:899 stop:1102 length:204 start_codon:yes stop_codon:yes gene_type:complete
MHSVVVSKKQASREYNLLVACDMPEGTKPNGDTRTFGEWLLYKNLRLENREEQKKLDAYWDTLEEDN